MIPESLNQLYLTNVVLSKGSYEAWVAIWYLLPKYIAILYYIYDFLLWTVY